MTGELSVACNLLLDRSLVREDKGDKCFLSKLDSLVGTILCRELSFGVVLEDTSGVELSLLLTPSSVSSFTSASSASRCSLILWLTPDLGLKE